jgi:hypothetical protein
MRPFSLNPRNSLRSVSIARLLLPSDRVHSFANKRLRTTASSLPGRINTSITCWSRSSTPTRMGRLAATAAQTRSRKMAGVSTVPCISPTMVKRRPGRDHNCSAPLIPAHEGCCSARVQETTNNRREKRAKYTLLDFIRWERSCVSADLPLNVDVSLFGCGACNQPGGRPPLGPHHGATPPRDQSFTSMFSTKQLWKARSSTSSVSTIGRLSKLMMSTACMITSRGWQRRKRLSPAT